jgi:VRR-NUC domain
MSQLEVDTYQARMRAKYQPVDAIGDFEGDESELHDQIISECQRRRFYFVHSRTDQRTTQQKGVPDFICAAPNGITYWIEIKTATGKLTPEQNVTRHVLGALDHQFHVVRSFAEFISVISGMEPEKQQTKEKTK